MIEATRIGTAMVVDDDEFDQRVSRHALERSGLVDQVVCFTYPDEALDFLRQRRRPKIDVVFLDVNMPRLNGIDFLEVVNEEFGESCFGTVVMISGSDSAKERAKAVCFPMVSEYLSKPLQVSDLINVCALLSPTPVTPHAATPLGAQEIRVRQ